MSNELHKIYHKDTGDTWAANQMSYDEFNQRYISWLEAKVKKLYEPVNGFGEHSDNVLEHRSHDSFEIYIKNKLAIRGFDKKTIDNNRGLIGAVIDETILITIKNKVI